MTPDSPTGSRGPNDEAVTDPRDSDAGLRRIGDALAGLRYGSVLVIVQDGVIVQIERTEKTRLEKPTSVPRHRR